MRLRLMLALASLLVWQGASAAGQGASADLAATRRIYEALIAGPAPRLAELTLFTTLLPKGADLHHHYSGAIYAETYLDRVAAQQWCVFTAGDKALGIEAYTVSTAPQSLPPAARALCLSADAVRQDGVLYRELLQRWSDKDFDNHGHDQPPPDQQFFETFGYFGPMAGIGYHDGLRSLKARALAENVGYLETMLRGAPVLDKPELNAALAPLNASGNAEFGRAFDALARDADVAAAIQSYLALLDDAAAGLDDDRFRLRFQSYVSRNNPPATVFAGLYAAFASAAQGRRVVGVNIVGPENGVVAMRDYALHMQMIGFLHARWPQVRLALHAGELALGMVPPEGLRSHIHDAVLVAGAHRIGHGVDIAHEDDAPALLALMRSRAVAVEINLSSNAFILGVRDAAHPLSLYRAFGVPYVISTDDAGVSRSSQSAEYLLYTSRYKPGYDELKRVVRDSIRFAFLSDVEKREELARLDRRFAEFEHRIAGMPLGR